MGSVCAIRSHERQNYSSLVKFDIRVHYHLWCFTAPKRMTVGELRNASEHLPFMHLLPSHVYEVSIYKSTLLLSTESDNCEQFTRVTGYIHCMKKLDVVVRTL